MQKNGEKKDGGLGNFSSQEYIWGTAQVVQECGNKLLGESDAAV